MFAVNLARTSNETIEEHQAGNRLCLRCRRHALLVLPFQHPPLSTGRNLSSTTLSKSSNLAVSTGIQAGGLLAAFGFVASILL